MNKKVIYIIFFYLFNFFDGIHTMIIIAHRGASAYAPENTLWAFKKALELHADMIEFDVHQCASGEIVILHDTTVDRTTDGTGFVHEKTLEQLKTLNIKIHDSHYYKKVLKNISKTPENNAYQGYTVIEKIPTLEQALDYINRQACVNIELKGKNTAEPVAEIIKRYIKIGWEYNDFLVSSFNHHELKKIKALLPELRIAPLICSLPLNYAECARQLNAYALHLSNEAIDENLILDAHKHGIKTHIYTINNKKELEALKNLKVDGIFTDYPDIKLE